MGKAALITGITGQDGSYMAEYLTALGYRVYGLIRRKPQNELGLAEHLVGEVEFLYGDVMDMDSCVRVITSCNPDEIYHFAAQSHVGASFDCEELTERTNISGTRNMLMAARYNGDGRGETIAFYNACSSEMFGAVVPGTKLNEESKFASRSPYAASKIAAYHIGCNYRDRNLVRVWNGIAFNHESERRPVDFVTRKVTQYCARLSGHLTHVMGKNEPIVAEGVPPLVMGNLDAYRDWGYAPDYVVAFHAMLQLEGWGDDFVVATGIAHSIEDLLARAFRHIGVKDWKQFVHQDPRFMRPTDVPFLCGDASKLREHTGWQPTTDFDDMVRKMIEADEVRR